MNDVWLPAAMYMVMYLVKDDLQEKMNYDVGARITLQDRRVDRNG